MIEIVKGEVVNKGDQYLVILTGGIGMKVWTPSLVSDAAELGEVTYLYTDLILRENDVNLYGFIEAKTRDLFRTLVKINGVGPKAALSILSTLTLQNIYQAVFQKDVQRFILVHGIGKKTAQKIILYLQDELGPLTSVDDGFTSPVDIDTELLDALVGLGYSIVEAQASIQSLPEDVEDDLETRLRLALRYFS